MAKKKKNFLKKLLETDEAENIFYDHHLKPRLILHRMKIVLPATLIISLAIYFLIDNRMGLSILLGGAMAGIISIFGYYELKHKDKLIVNKTLSMFMTVLGFGMLLSSRIGLASPELKYAYIIMASVGIVSFLTLVIAYKKLY